MSKPSEGQQRWLMDWSMCHKRKGWEFSLEREGLWDLITLYMYMMKGREENGARCLNGVPWQDKKAIDTNQNKINFIQI